MANNKLTKTEDIINNLIKNKLIVLLIIFLFLFMTVLFTGWQRKEYSSNAQILIIQEQEQKMDAYLASKSSESLAKNLKKAILTSSFRNKVLEDLSDIDSNIFQSEKNRRKEWIRFVDVKIISNTSILEITTYHQSAFQSERILNKILSTLVNNHQLYHGGGDDIRLEIINDPLTSTHPIRPNWALNLFLGFVLSIFFIITLLVLFPNKIYFFSKKLKKKNSRDKNKYINEKKGNFKVFDYLELPPENNVDLPEDLFEEEKIEDYEEGFFRNNESIYEEKGEVNNNVNNGNTIEVQNNDQIKEIIGNNHYLKRKE